MRVQIKNPAKGKLRTSSSTIFGPLECAIAHTRRSFSPTITTIKESL